MTTRDMTRLAAIVVRVIERAHDTKAIQRAKSRLKGQARFMTWAALAVMLALSSFVPFIMGNEFSRAPLHRQAVREISILGNLILAQNIFVKNFSINVDGGFFGHQGSSLLLGERTPFFFWVREVNSPCLFLVSDNIWSKNHFATGGKIGHCELRKNSSERKFTNMHIPEYLQLFRWRLTAISNLQSGSRCISNQPVVNSSSGDGYIGPQFLFRFTLSVQQQAKSEYSNKQSENSGKGGPPIIKKFADLPYRDKGNVLIGALFLLCVLVGLAYLIVRGDERGMNRDLHRNPDDQYEQQQTDDKAPCFIFYQHDLIAAPKMSTFLRLLYRTSKPSWYAAPSTVIPARHDHALRPLPIPFSGFVVG